MRTNSKTNHLLIALSIAAIPLALPAQDTAPLVDPYVTATGATAKAKAKRGQPLNIEVRYETFSLPLAEAAGLSRETLPDSKLYERLLRMIEGGKARQERFTVIRVLSGQPTATESIAETIYATEYEPANLPNSIGVQLQAPRGKDTSPGIPDTNKLDGAPRPEDLGSLRTPATPTAFETRNLGHALEVEAILEPGSMAIELRCAAENVRLVGHSVHGQGLSETRMPEIETQRLSGAATVTPGIPHLLGTVSRPPVSVVDPDSASTTWFAFVTARPVIAE